MNEETAVVISEAVQLGTVQAASPEDIVKRASSVATVLANVIDDKKLFKVINNKKYVQVDGWATLGAMLGVLPRETKSEKIENGYLAFVELIRTTDGMVIGGASAICTREERNWSKRDEYAIKSMATTRATGKAYRLGFSWIMNLAGYESTPAEEMIVDAEFIQKKEGTQIPIKTGKTPQNEDPKREKSKPAQAWTSEQIAMLVDLYPEVHPKELVSRMNLSTELTRETSLKDLEKWFEEYAVARKTSEPFETALAADNKLFG